MRKLKQALVWMTVVALLFTGGQMSFAESLSADETSNVTQQSTEDTQGLQQDEEDMPQAEEPVEQSQNDEAEQNADYQAIEVNETPQEEDESVTVKEVDAKNVRITHEEGVTVILRTATGSIVQPCEDSGTEAAFDVAPGNYTWITTLDNDYHATGEVTVGSGTAEAVQVEGVTPKKEALVKSLAVKSSTGTTAVEYEADRDFSWKDHEYSYFLSDSTTGFAVYADREDKAIAIECGAYTRTDTGAQVKEKTLLSSNVGSLSGKQALTGFITNGGKGNSVIITAGKTDGDVTYYQEYKLTAKRIATVSSLEVKDANNVSYPLMKNGDETKKGFDSDVPDYTINIGKKMGTLDFTFGFPGASRENNVTGNYTITVNGQDFSRTGANQKETKTVFLDPSKDQEVVTLTVASEYPENRVRQYNVTVNKIPQTALRFDLSPKDGSVYLIENLSGNRVWPEEDGSFDLMKGASYTYTATAYGYVGTKAEFVAEESKTIKVALKKAEKNTEIDENIEAEWPYFRADENNNGVVDIELPTKAEEAVLYWANKIGEGYSSGAAGSPILADGYIYTYAGNKVFKVNPMTGKVEAFGTMVGSSSFAINSPTYAEGMIFIGLSNGTVQAFNAKTLESLWVYKDSLGGQPNCPITYRDGYIYTGFWNSETKQANMVCLSITDEDPSRTQESKLATWIHTDAGFYWAGAYASQNYVIVGTDDGESGYTKGYGDLLSLNPTTGQVIDRIENGFAGDIRSSIMYDEKTNRYYFTTKGGYFCSVAVNADGTFKHDSVTRLYLDNYTDNAATPPMSTSTPVVHNGRAYIGVSGISQFGQYSGHNITVIDLTGAQPEIAYTVRTKGYPQTSGLLTTAYDEGDGTVYVYFFDNYTPGQLRMLRDKPGQLAPDLTQKESVSSGGTTTEYDAAYTLFTPFGKQAQYAICSPIADEWGNIYFKNDSAYMMMLGAVITKLEVTKQPDKTVYLPGQKFSGDGMTVTATYANGKTRDVTAYVKYTNQELTMDDTEIDIIFDIGEHMQMYQDKDGVAGTVYVTPQTSVKIKMSDGTCEGGCTEWKSIRVQKEATCTEDGEQLLACTVCGNEKTEIIPAAHVMGEWIYEDPDPDKFSQNEDGDTVVSGTKVQKCTRKGCDHQNSEMYSNVLKVETKTDGALEKDAGSEAALGEAGYEEALAILKQPDANMTEKEKKELAAQKQAILAAVSAGTPIIMELTCEEPDLTKEEIRKDRDKIAENMKQNENMLMLLDIKLNLKTTKGDILAKITELHNNNLVTLQIKLEDWQLKEGRTFSIVSVHDGKFKSLSTNRDGNLLTAQSGAFSVYAVLYEDTEGGTPMQSGGTVTGMSSGSTNTIADRSGSASSNSLKMLRNGEMSEGLTELGGDDAVPERITPDMERDSWSLVNLIIVFMIAALCIVMIIGIRRNKPEGLKKLASLLSIVPATAAIVTFAITQDLTQEMGYADNNTLTMAIILLAQILVFFLTKANLDTADDSE